MSALLAGCATTFGAGGPAPLIDENQPAYWIWHDGHLWRVRSTAAGKPHRFQGSIEGLTGGIVEVRAEREELRDHVAQVGSSVQFDYDTEDRAPRGFDARTTGGCLRFDLMIDGKRRPDVIRYGRKAETPNRLPADLCP